MADKSSFIPVNIADGAKPDKKGDIDIDIDDNEYFGGGSKPAAQVQAPRLTPRPAPVQSSPVKKKITYSKPSSYHKSYAAGPKK